MIQKFVKARIGDFGKSELGFGNFGKVGIGYFTSTPQAGCNTTVKTESSNCDVKD